MNDAAPPRPAFTKGMQVEVNEEGIRPWRGTAEALKFSKVSGWWFDVRGADGMTRVIHAKRVHP